MLRLNQVLLNLISNAYKFTPEGGSIRVTVSELPMQQEQFFYKFVVTDTGEGMSEEMQERLFLPFEQEEAETAQHHGGSGLRTFYRQKSGGTDGWIDLLPVEEGCRNNLYSIPAAGTRSGVRKSKKQKRRGR